jgi:hypothetical protein
VSFTPRLPEPMLLPGNLVQPLRGLVVDNLGNEAEGAVHGSYDGETLSFPGLPLVENCRLEMKSNGKNRPSLPYHSKLFNQSFANMCCELSRLGLWQEWSRHQDEDEFWDIGSKAPSLEQAWHSLFCKTSEVTANCCSQNFHCCLSDGDQLKGES